MNFPFAKAPYTTAIDRAEMALARINHMLTILQMRMLEAVNEGDIELQAFESSALAEVATVALEQGDLLEAAIHDLHRSGRETIVNMVGTIRVEGEEPPPKQPDPTMAGATA